MDNIYIKYLIIIIAVLMVVCILIVVHDMNCVKVRKYVIPVAGLEKTWHFVFLSDLHNMSFGKNNSRLAARIKKLKPDAVLSGGDLYNSKPGAGYNNAVELIKKLCENFPVYMTNGNHETKTKLYPKDFDHQYEKYTEELKAAGAVYLVNDYIDIEDTNIRLTAYELDHGYFRHFIRKRLDTVQIENVVGRAAEGKINVLMAHHPIYLKNYAEWGASVVLSGHIHGGIVRIPWIYSRKKAERGEEKSGTGIRMRGIIAPMIWLFPIFDGGLFKRGNTTMILSRGLGTHSIPVRFFNPCELVEVVMEPVKQAH